MNGALVFVGVAFLVVAALVFIETVARLLNSLPTSAAKMEFTMSYADPYVALERLEGALAEHGGRLEGNHEAGNFRAPIDGHMVEGIYELRTLESFLFTIESNPAELSVDVIAAAIREYAEPRPAAQPIAPDLITE